MPKRGRKKTAKEFSDEQWMLRKIALTQIRSKSKDLDRSRKRRLEDANTSVGKIDEADRDRKPKRRKLETTPEREQRLEAGRKREENRRKLEHTAEKKQRLEADREFKANRRKLENTAEKKQRLEADRESKANRRKLENTAEKKQRLEADRELKSNRRKLENTVEKRQRLEADREIKSKSRKLEGTAEKRQRLDAGREREETRRQKEITAEKKQRLEAGREREEIRRQKEITAEKKQRLEAGRKRESDRRKQEKTAEKKQRREADRVKKVNSRQLSQVRRSLDFDAQPKSHPDDIGRPSNENAVDNNAEDSKRADKCGGSDDIFCDNPTFSGITGDILTDEFMHNPLNAFHAAMWSLENTMCINCKERSFLIDVDKKGWCQRCRSKRRGNDAKKFTEFNDLDPGEVPEELKDLFVGEQILIARAVPMMAVYRRPLGQLAYSGNTLIVAQDVQHVVDVLPRAIEDCGLVTFRYHGKAGTHKDFRVRRNKVRSALLWLRQHNKRYEHITVSDERIDSLPEDGFIDVDVIDDDNAGDACGSSGLGKENEPSHPVLQLDSTDVDLKNMGHGNGKDNEMCGEAVEEPECIESFIPWVVDKNSEAFMKEKRVDQVFGTRRRSDVPVPSSDLPVVDWPSRNFEDPIDEFKTAGFIQDCFPHLFPHGKCEFTTTSNRPIKVSEMDFFKHLINWHDGRFAKDSRFRYYALNCILRHRAMTTGRVFVKNNPEMAKIAIEELQNMSREDKKKLLQNVLRYGQSFPGTKQYWQNRRAELLAMIKQKNTLPTVFFTLSAADLQWPDLHRHMPEYNDRRAAVNENPLLCNVFFYLRVKKFLDLMKKVYKMTDYWGRFEYQHRGSIHFHGLAWFEDAPDVKDLMSKTDAEKAVVTKYFDELLTSVNPGLNDDGSGYVKNIKPNPATVPYFRVKDVFEDEETDYTGIIMYCNRHRCRKGYCCKEVKGVTQSCRFGFPKDFTVETNLEVVKDKKDREVMSLNLKRNDRWINSHTRIGSLANRANTDFQGVVSEEGVVGYCAKYVTKPETMQNAASLLLGRVALNAVTVTDPVRQIAQKALIRLISDRDYSAQETIHILLSLPLYVSSRTFFSLFLSGDRELTKEDGEPVLVSNPVDKYCSRSRSLETMSMMEVFGNHRLVNGEFRKLVSANQIIVVPRGLRKTSKESPLYEEYCQHYLMLHKPFRTMGHLLGEFSLFSEAYEDFLKKRKLRQCCFDDLEDRVLEEQHMPRDKEDEMQKNDDDRDRVLEDYALLLQIDPEIAGTVAGDFDWCAAYSEHADLFDNAKHFHQSMDTNGSPGVADDTLKNLKLNDEQKAAFDFVKQHVENQKENKEPLKTIITGSAGTGKTLFIRKLKEFLGEKLLIMAPTGVAACNAGGVTINSALGIPAIIGEDNFADKTNASVEALQERLKTVEYVILEEMSMIGLRKFCMIDRRLRQAFPSKSNMFFGGRSILMIGDFGQLPPIGDYPLFRFVTKDWSDIASGISPFQAHGLLAYLDFQSSFKFKTVVRQAGDTKFRDMLQRLRVGETTIEDYNMLSSRFKGNATDKHLFEDAVHLFTTRKEVAEFNANKLKKLSPIALISADHTGGSAATKADSEDAGNLEATILLAKGAKVMLTANLNVSKGLCNGTMGIVEDIIYRSGGPPNLPACVLCKFEDYNGPAFFADRPKVVPILPITRRFSVNQGIECSRTNIPLRLAWAITVHKSQGLTLPKVAVDLGNKEFGCGLSFVALSRVRELKDLLLTPFKFERLRKLGDDKKDGSNPTRVLRQEDHRLEALSRGKTGKRIPGLQSDVQKGLIEMQAVCRDIHAGAKKSKKKIGGLTIEGESRVKTGVATKKPVKRILDRKRSAKKSEKTGKLDGAKPSNFDVCGSGDESIIVDARSFLRPETTFVTHEHVPDMFMFNPLSEEHMRDICGRLHIQFFGRDAYGPSGFRHEGATPRTIIQVPGDGHCFYYAISRAIAGTRRHHLHLRRLLSQFCEEHNGVWSDPEVISGIRNDEWAGHSAIMSMSEMLQVPIYTYMRVYSRAGDEHSRFRWLRFGTASNAGIYIFHCDVYGKPAVNGNHFVLVTHV